MSHIAIKAESLGKRYRIGARRRTATTWGEAALRALGTPFEYLRTTLRGPTAEETLWALTNVSFEIEQGEVVGLIGRNGAGKSTLLKILSRITEPTRGRAEIHGRVASLLEVGTGFHKELTGRENVYLNGAILGMTRAEIKRKFDEIVEFAGVEAFIDTPVKRYSSGMHVRLGFAVAVHLEPEILLIDEVLAVGDATFQRRCLGKLGEIATQGRTVLFVSHNMTAIRSLCERCMLIDAGTLAATGPADQIVDQYISAGLQETRERVWSDPSSAPGNDHVRVQRVAVVPRCRDVDGPITVETPFDVHFSFWNLRPAQLHLSMHVRRLSGETIFVAGSPKCDIASGLAEFSCHVPQGLMNDGAYSILMMIVKDSRSLYQLEDAVVFEVQDIEREGNWFGKWPGAVRPQLDWTHEFAPRDLLSADNSC